MNGSNATLGRRSFCLASLAAVGGGALLSTVSQAEQAFKLRHIVGSAMYGKTPLSELTPELPRIGTRTVNLWCEPHGNQREQLERMGGEAFRELLAEHDVTLGGLTRYDLFPFDVESEIGVCADLGGTVMIGHGSGPRDAEGQELRKNIADFCERMKPLGEKAGDHGVTLAIENHRMTRLRTIDGIRWFVEMAPPGVGLCYAPQHLPQDGQQQAALIEEFGEKIVYFYAQQRGENNQQEQPREVELLQMPGRGPLDFEPMVAALKKVGFNGYTEICMHPYPRGIPMHESTQAVTREITRARAYLDACARKA